MTLRAICTIALFADIGCNPRVEETAAPSLRIVATDSGFEAPNRVPAGIRHIVFENHGSEIHEAMLVKLPDGMSPSDYSAAVKAGSLFPKGALDYSGPGLTSPGETAEIWLKVDPGNYVLICWNAGHSKTTPVRPLTVEYTISDDKVPKEDVVLQMFDYRFEFVGTLRKGRQVIRVETPGPSMHEIDIYRLHEGKSLADIRRWRKEPQRIPAPADALGGALDSHDIKRIVWLRKNFAPGRYVFHCGMPVNTSSDITAHEMTHDDLGMIRQVDIPP